MVSGEGSVGAVSNDALFFRPDHNHGFGAYSAICEADRHRLVKGSKSPTRYQGPLNARIFNSLGLVKAKPEPLLIDDLPSHPLDCREPGAYTVVSHREWSDEYRIRTQIQGTVGNLPPEQAGIRATEILTERGARKIAESCEYMHLKRGGYTTFLTLTLDAEARERVANEETTVQNEVSRFFDGLQKMYQRGFEYVDEQGRVQEVAGSPKIDGKRERLDYLWVAECPDTIDTESGEVMGQNPHVHVLMRYRVPFQHFKAWSKRVESLWGQGFAHLEKIKDGEKAGAYMAKAAGYLCKAQGKTDQGTIRGNRYAISASARAPDWVCVGLYELGKMGFLIAEAAENFAEKFGHVKLWRDVLKHKLSMAKHGPTRQKIGALLEKTRAQLKRMPRLSKYQAILKGPEQAMAFLEWARTDQAVTDHAWLPDKPSGCGFAHNKGSGQWLTEFTRQKDARKWRQWCHWNDEGWRRLDSMIDQLRRGEMPYPANDADGWDEVMTMFHEYERAAA